MKITKTHLRCFVFCNSQDICDFAASEDFFKHTVEHTSYRFLAQVPDCCIKRKNGRDKAQKKANAGAITPLTKKIQIKTVLMERRKDWGLW